MEPYEMYDRLIELMSKSLYVLHNQTILDMGRAIVNQCNQRFGEDDDTREMADLIAKLQGE